MEECVKEAACCRLHSEGISREDALPRPGLLDGSPLRPFLCPIRLAKKRQTIFADTIRRQCTEEHRIAVV